MSDTVVFMENLTTADDDLVEFIIPMALLLIASKASRAYWRGWLELGDVREEEAPWGIPSGDSVEEEEAERFGSDDDEEDDVDGRKVDWEEDVANESLMFDDVVSWSSDAVCWEDLLFEWSDGDEDDELCSFWVAWNWYGCNGSEESCIVVEDERNGLEEGVEASLGSDLVGVANGLFCDGSLMIVMHWSVKEDIVSMISTSGKESLLNV